METSYSKTGRKSKLKWLFMTSFSDAFGDGSDEQATIAEIQSDVAEAAEPTAARFIVEHPIKAIFQHLPKNSLAKTLRTTFLRLGFVLLLVGGIGIGALLYTNVATSELLNRLQPLITYNNDMLIQVLDMNTDVRNYLREGEQLYINSYYANKASYERDLAGALALENAKATSASMFKDQSSEAQSLFNLFETTALSIPPTQLTPTAANNSLISINQSLQRYQSLYGTTNDHLQSERSVEQNRIGSVLLFTSIATAAIIAASLIIGLRRALITRLKVQQLLDRLTHTLSKLEAGEKNVRAPMTGLEEEQLLATAINNMAMQRESLTTELEKRYEQEKELREGLALEQSLREGLTTAVYKDLDLASALLRTVEGLGPALHADRALVRLFEAGQPAEVISQWFSSDLPISLQKKGFPSAESRTVVYNKAGKITDALNRGLVVAVSDVAADDQLTVEARNAVIETGLGAFLIAPVVGSEGLQATLVAAMESRPRIWSDRDIQIARTMADGLAATLAAIRLYEQERSNLVALKKLDESKDLFLASVSHELRTPLTSIIGYLELLEDAMSQGDIPFTYSPMIDAISRNSERLLELIENILTASRIESGALQLAKTKTHLTALLMRAAETVMPQVNLKSIRFNIRTGTGIPDTELDTNLLERAVVNLLSNAVKFTPQGGTISLNTVQAGEDIAIAISDSGIGIAEDEMENLFTKFYRTSSARYNAVQGSGLGLMIVKAIVEAHGGRVTVASKIGEGTTFTLLLPIEVGADSQTNRSSSTQSTSPATK